MKQRDDLEPVSFRLPSHYRRLLLELMEQRDQTVSRWIRRKVIEAIKAELSPHQDQTLHQESIP